jgi:hypothetical protein
MPPTHGSSMLPGVHPGPRSTFRPGGSRQARPVASALPAPPRCAAALGWGGGQQRQVSLEVCAVERLAVLGHPIQGHELDHVFRFLAEVIYVVATAQVLQGLRGEGGGTVVPSAARPSNGARSRSWSVPMRDRLRDGTCSITPVATGGRSRSRGPPARRSDECRGGGAQCVGTAAVGAAEKRGCSSPGWAGFAPRPGAARLRCPGERKEPADG